MEPIDVARRLVSLGETEDAVKAYELVLRAQNVVSADEKMEAALFVLQFCGEYRYAYLAFLELCKESQYAKDAMAIITEAFYEPNKKLLRSHYENNCKYLSKYPYLFQKEFIPFEELPIRFYPYDDGHYVPYYVEEGRFGEVTDYSDPVITRNYFYDLENPILAKDVYSQYELEYLNDNVRLSEHVSRENHVYLHYSSWAEFCAYLQVLNFRKLLADRKLVFLMEDEISQYPIDFKERFGIDYSIYPLRPVGVREVNRLIWHMQLSYHNGGDFFNEIMDAHPNLLSSSSIFHDSMEETMDDLRSTLNDARSWAEVKEVFSNGEWENFDMIRDLYFMRDRTDKDILVATFFCCKRFTKRLDPNSRIVPAIFYQPHFGYIHTDIKGDNKGHAIVTSEQYEAIEKSTLIKYFKYIKSFAPMRRITTSYGGAVRFMDSMSGRNEDGKYRRVANEVVERVLYRGYLVDSRIRIFRDCVVVRFEDGKLNPKATFTALAKFLDLPYTKSMTYCSFNGLPTQVMLKQEVHGFDTTSVYKTYDDFACDEERWFLEYFLQDAYRYYGYDFKYYDGQPASPEKIREKAQRFDTIYSFIRKSMKTFFEETVVEMREKAAEAGEEQEYANTVEEEAAQSLEKYMRQQEERTMSVTNLLLGGLKFVAKDGQPLEFMPRLDLDPELLEQPLYR